MTAVITKKQIMDQTQQERQERFQQEMMKLAEKRIDIIAGKDTINISKKLTAEILDKSVFWVDQMVAEGKLPFINVGKGKAFQRPVILEILVFGM